MLKLLRNLYRFIERGCNRLSAWCDIKNPMWKAFRAISKVLYFVRAHTFDKYHLIDLRKNNNDLYKWGWIDADRQILIANMNIFQTFMEGEYKSEMIDWDCDWIAEEFKDDPDTQKLVQEKRADHQSMLDILNWWTIDYRANQKLLDELLMALNGNFDLSKDINKQFIFTEDKQLADDIYRLLESELDDQETRMLKALMDIRTKLWT